MGQVFQDPLGQDQEFKFYSNGDFKSDGTLLRYLNFETGVSKLPTSSVFVNNTLLEHSHSHSLNVMSECFCTLIVELSSGNKDYIA